MVVGSLPLMTLRVGVVQFGPKIGQVQANLRRARELTDNIQPSSVDLLCFPEMAFTGYNFENAAAVEPFLEKPRFGPTSAFCSELAKRLQCYVVAGYPELLEPEELKQCIQEDRVEMEAPDTSVAPMPEPSTRKERRIVGANSAVIYGPGGEWTGGYRKANLFRTDKTWAASGSGFAAFKLPPPLSTVTLAICMDLNPFPGNNHDGACELANYCRSRDTDLLVLLNAWLDPQVDGEEEHSWSTLRYWAARLRPLWWPGNDEEGPGELHSSENRGFDKSTTVLICNRTGEENGVTFAGSSAIFEMNRAKGRPKLVDMMAKDEEGIRIWTVQLNPSKSL